MCEVARIKDAELRGAPTFMHENGQVYTWMPPSSLINIFSAAPCANWSKLLERARVSKLFVCAMRAPSSRRAKNRFTSVVLHVPRA